MTFSDAVSVLVQVRAVLGLSEAEDLVKVAREMMQENAKLKSLLGRLVEQISINDFTDSYGHPAKMLQPYLEALSLAPPPGAIPGGK